jgi:D-alanyl-lipoteichoic acid acyltransferase DltB (MBOAT superfamily)
MTTPGAVVVPGREQAQAVSVLSHAGLRWALLGVQLGLILALAWAFEIESPAFYLRILPLAVGGAVIHHLLPLRYRPAMFALLGLVGILVVFGPGPGSWMVGLGLTLIGLCHLPIEFRWRVVLVALAGLGLMLLRARWVWAPWPGVIWPVLGSMFMFRLGIYLYDLRHRREPAEPGLIFSYFFMLPNVVFLLFPVIDFQTFRRTYYDRPALEIYEEGAQWMLRGLTHLVLYRLVYAYAVIGPTEVQSTAGITRYLVSNFGLYLRVSGQFHLIVGMLHLFGFRLPETHRFFYLASSFSDLWRRINIYWKDFMQKMVYLPAVMGLKRRGETAALVGATLSVVVATWFLHSYQWFWLLGRWLFSAPDMIFWGLLGTLLMANTLWEQRRGRARQLTARGASAAEAWREAGQTAGMFTLMCLLWGFWSSETIVDFWAMLGAATLRGRDVAVVGATLGSVVAAAFVSRRYGLGAPAALATRRWWQHPLVNAALPLGALWLVGEPALVSGVPASLQAMAWQTRKIDLNVVDAERLQRGYYEQIVGVERTNGELWTLYARAGKDDEADVDHGPHSPLLYADDGFGNRAYRPNVSRTFKGFRFSTNRWGMRDRDYELTPPPGTWRIAVMGPSYVVGSGVNDGEPFEALVEDRLNREWSPKTGLHYELLNFAIAQVSPTELASMLTSPRVSQFRPDVVLLVGQVGMGAILNRHLLRKLRGGQRLSELEEEWRLTAGIEPGQSLVEMRRRARSRWLELLRPPLDIAASAIRRMGAQPVFALIHTPGMPPDLERKSTVLALAAELGYRILDFEDTFRGYDPKLLQVSSADRHPNAEGHRIIATRLFTELTTRAELLSPGGVADSARAQQRVTPTPSQPDAPKVTRGRQ